MQLFIVIVVVVVIKRQPIMTTIKSIYPSRLNLQWDGSVLSDGI